MSLATIVVLLVLFSAPSLAIDLTMAAALDDGAIEVG